LVQTPRNEDSGQFRSEQSQSEAARQSVSLPQAAFALQTPTSGSSSATSPEKDSPEDPFVKGRLPTMLPIPPQPSVMEPVGTDLNPSIESLMLFVSRNSSRIPSEISEY
jgi:hypothetical protein